MTSQLHSSSNIVKHALMTCEKSKQHGIVTNITAVIVLSGYDAKQNSSQANCTA